MKLEAWILGIGATLVLSIVGSRLTSRLGIPVLLLFLVLGMLAGSDGPGGIWFSDAQAAQNIGVIALLLILFSGGMDLNWKASRPYVPHAASLATLGVAITALVVGLAAHFALGFSLLEGLLLGSIVASTDAAAVFSTLTHGGVNLSPKLQSILEMESGSNDPTAIFLTVALVGLVAGQEFNLAAQSLSFLWQMSLGVLGGWLGGRLGVIAMRKLRLDFEGMFHGLSLAVVLVTFGGVTLLGGNGFLAAYAAGIAFGNGDFRQRKGLRRFHDGIAWLMQIALFIVLGLLVFPKQLPFVIAPGLLVCAVLMLVARPLGVFISLIPFRLSLKEQILISWCGLRGAVPIVLATFPLLAGLDRANEFFNLVFFVVLFSTALQGPTIPFLAKKLGLNEPQPAPA